MSSWKDSFLQAVTPEDASEQPQSNFEVSNEFDFFGPPRKWDWDIISEEEIEEVTRIAGILAEQEAREAAERGERSPLLASQVSTTSYGSRAGDRSRQTWHQLIGFVISVIACFFLSLSLASIQLMHHQLQDNELNVWRFLGSILVGLPISFYRCEFPVIRTKRQILGSIAITVLTYGFNFCYFAAVKMMPIGTLSCIYRTAILIVTTVLAMIINRERLTVAKALAVIVGMVGLVLITEPWVHQKEDKFKHLWLGYVLSTAAGVVASLKIVVQKKYCQETDVMGLQFWTSLGCLILAIIFMVSLEDMSVPTTTNDWLFLMAHAFSCGIATLLIYKAQQMISPILYSLSCSFNVFFSLIGQYTVLRHIQPGFKNGWEYSGAALVVLSAILVPVWQAIKIRCERRRARLEAD